MSDAASRKKSGKKAKRKESSSPKSAKSGKSRNSSDPGSPKEDPPVIEIAGNSCFRHHKEVKYFHIKKKIYQQNFLFHRSKPVPCERLEKRRNRFTNESTSTVIKPVIHEILIQSKFVCSFCIL